MATLWPADLVERERENLDTFAEREEAISHWLIAASNAIEQLKASLGAVAQGNRPPAASETLAAGLQELLGCDLASIDPRCIEKTEAANRALALAFSVAQRARFLQSLPLPGVTDEGNEKVRIARWREFPEPADDELRSVLAGRFADWRNARTRNAEQEHAVPRLPGERSSTAQIKRRMSTIQRDIEAAEAAHAAGELANLTGLMATIDQALKAGPATAPLTHRIEALRREQLRLRDWQRWDDGQRREQLVAEAQELARITTSKVSIKAHAEAINTLRLRWKDLDKLCDTTNKAMWLKFDGALKAAYAPVAAHLEKQKRGRQENLAARDQIIDTLVQAAEKYFPAGGQGSKLVADSRPEWRELARTLDQTRIAWRKLGRVEHSVPRKAQTGDSGVVTRFERATQLLEGPLKEANRQAVEQRRQLIDAANNLRGPAAVAARDLVDKVRALQAQWQSHATAFALPRSDETALWTELKTAIDALFAERDAVRSAKETQFSTRLKAREQIIERLLALPSSSDASYIKRAIAEVDTAWGASAEVGKAQATQLDSRYRAAREAATKRLGKLALLALQARFDALIAKIALCDEHEMTGERTPSNLDARWNAIANMPDAWNRKLEARFRTPIHSNRSLDSNPLVDSNSKSAASLSEILLNLEVACGIESPDEFLAARHQLKLRALKNAMEGRQTSAATSADIERWLLDAAATPCPDEVSQVRLAKIIAALRLRAAG